MNNSALLSIDIPHEGTVPPLRLRNQTLADALQECGIIAQGLYARQPPPTSNETAYLRSKIKEKVHRLGQIHFITCEALAWRFDSETQRTVRNMEPPNYSLDVSQTSVPRSHSQNIQQQTQLPPPNTQLVQFHQSRTLSPPQDSGVDLSRLDEAITKLKHAMNEDDSEQHEINLLRRRLSISEHACAEVRIQYEEQQQYTFEINQKYSTLEKQCQDLACSKKDFEDRVLHLEHMRAQVDADHKRLHEKMEKEIKDLRKRNQDLDATVLLHNTTIQQQNVTIEKLKFELETLSTQKKEDYERYERNYNLLMIEKDEVIKHHQQSRQVLQKEHNIEIERHQGDIKRLTMEIEALHGLLKQHQQQSMTELKSKHDELEDVKDIGLKEKSKSEANLRSKQVQLDELVHKVTRLQDQLTAARKELEDARNSNSKLQDELEELRKSSDGQHQKLQDELAAARKELEELRKSSNDDLTRLRDELSRLKLEFSSLETKFIELTLVHSKCPPPVAAVPTPRTEVAQPWSGFEVSEATLMVKSIFPSGPAAVAGLKVSDKINRVNDISISTIEDLRRAMKIHCKVGVSVVFGVLRNGSPSDVTIVIGDIKQKNNL